METEQNPLFPVYSITEDRTRELIELMASIGDRDPNDEERGYIARMLVQACFPYRKIAGNEFSRIANSFRMTMMAPSEVGLPFGVMPRLIFMWMTREALFKKDRRLELGHSLTEFMTQLNLPLTGGKNGTITRLRDQMKRMASSTLSVTYDNGRSWSLRHVGMIEEAELWWEEKEKLKSDDQPGLWNSTILLSDSFFREITNRPVPFDMRVVQLIRERTQSPLALDLFLWLNYRLKYLSRPTEIPWEKLQLQFGANYADTRQGRHEFKKEFLKQVETVRWAFKKAAPSIQELTDGKGIKLLPGGTSIPAAPSLP
jgi:Plasmid encoded RepA protein